jgi:hypothetical protein
MLTEIRELQQMLGMADGEILKLARQVCGYEVRCIEDLLGCETLELLEDLRGMAEIEGLVGMAT